MRRGGAAVFLVLGACANGQDLPAGVSTAPQSVPRPAPEDASAPPPPATPVAVDVPAPPPPALGRLHPVTGMTMGAKKLDEKRVLARIEATPSVLDTCSGAASLEPNAPDGSWNVRLTISDGGKASLEVQSAVAAGFEACLVEAGPRLALAGLGSGTMMLLLGLTDQP